MAKPDTEHESPAGPGAVAKGALRAIDACIQALQRLRRRFAGTDERSALEERRGTAPKHEAADAGAPVPSPSLWRRLLVALILLLAGGAAGGLLAYRTLSHQLAAHAGIVERIQDELDATRKEDARNVKLLDKFQRENAEYRHEAREALREADNAKGRVAELEGQIEAMQREAAKRAELAAQQARRAAVSPRAKSSAPQKTGNCAVGSAGELSNCIEKFNR